MECGSLTIAFNGAERGLKEHAPARGGRENASFACVHSPNYCEIPGENYLIGNALLAGEAGSYGFEVPNLGKNRENVDSEPLSQ